MDGYDSSGDFWRLMEDGSLAYDGDGWLKDSNGNYILENGECVGADAVEGGLLKILKLEDNSVNREIVQKMMRNASMTEKGTGIWWKHEGNNEKAITLADSKYRGLYEEHLSAHNTLAIYNDMVEEGSMDLTPEYQAFTETLRYKLANVFGLGDKTAKLFGVEKYISYDEYKANNFIRGQPSYQTNDSYSGYPVTTLMGAGGSLTANPHRGTDAGTPKGTAAQLLFFNDTSVVSTVGTDKDSAQGLYVTVKTDIEYQFKGKNRTDSIYYRIMHLSETSVVKTDCVTQTTALGKTGNTGKLTNYSTGKDVVYGYHAHEDVYTQTMPSPYLDYLTGNTPNVTARLYYKPEDRFFYDKFIFANKNNYTIRWDANTYN
jgi:hypothetical protein